jgi:type II secretory pathway component GspD/PulD (secretin)
MPPTLEFQKWTRPSSFSANPRGYVFLTRDCLLARNFLSSSNAAQGATAKNGRPRPDILQFMFNKKTNRSQTGGKGMKSKMLIATLLGCLVWQQGALSQTDTIATNPAATDEVAPANQPAIATDTNQTIGTSTAAPPAAPVPVISAPESPGTTTSSVTTSTVTTTNETTGASAAIPPAAPVISAPESPGTTTSSVTTSTVTTTNETTGASAATPPATPVVSAPESPGTTTSSVTTSTVTTTNETARTANSQPSVPPSIPLIQFQDVPITTAIENLARQAGINYLIDPKIGYGQPDQNGQIKAEPTLSIRWENVTAGQALMALLDNYGLQLTEDRKSQIARITAKDPMAPLPLSTRVVQLKYASTSNMVDSVQASFTDKRSKVLPDVRTSQLIVVATEREQEALDALINALDKPTRQVLIETKLVQVSSNPQTSKGIDWSGTLAAQHVSFGNGIMQDSSLTTANIPGTPVTTTTPSTTTAGTPGSTTTTTIPGDSSHLPVTTTVMVDATPGTTTPGKSTTVTPSSSIQSLLNIAQGNGGMSFNTLSGLTPAIGFLNADGAHAVLSFLNQAYDAQIVSTPRIVTLDNQMATIEVTRGFPIIQMAGGTQNSSGSSSVTYSNVGTILQVTPRISANDYIWLKVTPMVSSHFGDQIVTVAGGGGNSSSSYTIPIFDYRRIDSQVMIPNGNTLVMGGLVTDNPTASYTKVPLLGDIPGLGWAFRSENKAMIKDNLIIFMTPTIIQNTDFQQASSAPSDYLQSKPAVMKSRMNPNSIWDGAQPRGDWSNPAPIPGEFDKK